MTGWTQFTARFEKEQHADAIVEDAHKADEQGELHIPYAESLGNIARVRILGYDKEADAIDMLRVAGPIEAALLAHFNDTTDSGYVDVFRNGDFKNRVARAESPQAGRWQFRFESFGLTETGNRAGNDFELEHEYGSNERKVVPLDRMERMTEEVLQTLKTQVRVEAEEYNR